MKIYWRNQLNLKSFTGITEFLDIHVVTADGNVRPPALKEEKEFIFIKRLFGIFPPRFDRFFHFLQRWKNSFKRVFQTREYVKVRRIQIRPNKGDAAGSPNLNWQANHLSDTRFYFSSSVKNCHAGSRWTSQKKFSNITKVFTYLSKKKRHSSIVKEKKISHYLYGKYK